MDIISTRLLPDRHRSTSTSRYEAHGQSYILKSYVNFDVEKLKPHFEWIRALNAPMLPQITDLKIQGSALEVTYKEIVGTPLWTSLETKDFSYVRNCFLTVIQQLKDFSQIYYNNKLPPSMGLIHTDFHMGNVIEHGNQLYLVDLENISLGCFSKMHREFALNIMGDPGFSFSTNNSFLLSLIGDLSLDQTTYSAYFKDMEKVIYHFYDYYREKPDYFKKEKQLKELLVETALRLNLAKI